MIVYLNRIRRFGIVQDSLSIYTLIVALLFLCNTRIVFPLLGQAVNE